MRNEEIIRELIAERERIDKLINSFCQSDDVDVPTVVQSTKPKKEYSFNELMEQSFGSMNELCTTSESAQPVTYVNNVQINIDNSYHTTTNHESRVNTTLAAGDGVVNALGGIIHNLFY